MMIQAVQLKLLGLAGTAMVSSLALCAPAAAQVAAKQAAANVKIGSLPAPEAILELGSQTGVQIVAPAADISGVRTNAVAGRMTALDAARKMFEGTGLSPVRVGESVVIRGKPNAKPAVRPQASADEGGFADGPAIVVTGSRVQKGPQDVLQSVQVTDREELQRRSYSNVLQALEATPGFGLSDSSPTAIGGSGASTFNTGASFANLFNLGSQRTLTLVNGRRFVSSNVVAGGNASVTAAGSQVDLNTIPVGLIERVETVAIGGAPVYGSDAIAGTVNIILKDDFEGLEVAARYGVSGRGDAASKMVRFLAGANFGDDRGNIVVAFEHNKQAGLLDADRFTPYRLVNNPADTGPNDGIPGRIVAENFRFTGLTSGGLPFRGPSGPGTISGAFPNGDYIVDAAGRPLQFGAGSKLVSFDPGVVMQRSGGMPVVSSGGDGLHTSAIASLYTPTTRHIMNVLAHYELTPGVTAFFEGNYARSRGVEQAELLSLFTPSLTGRSLTVSVDNAFLSDETRDILAANGITDSFQLARNNSDLLPPAQTTIELYRIVGGLRGSFEAFDRTLKWDVTFNHGHSRGTTEVTYVNDARFQEAANAITDINDNIVCASGNSACVPLNIFGVGNFSPEARAYVTDAGIGINTTTQQVVTANLSGELPFEIVAPIAFNIGAEYRKEKGAFEPDAVLEGGSSALGVALLRGYLPTRGEFDTKEVYGELSLPLIVPGNDVPLIKSLQFEGALRYVDHSYSGGATTWSAGARLSPRLPGGADGLTLRGVYTRSIRSPAIAELFLGRAPAQMTVEDPCDVLSFRSGTNPAVREANCRAALAAVGAGAPENFQQTRGFTQKGFSEGNRNLKNERAESWSVGFQYEPEGLRGLKLHADWSNITLRDGISAVNIQTLVNLCYDSPAFPATAACSAFDRLSVPDAPRATGDIADGFVSGYINAATIHFAGAIMGADYRFGLANDDTVRIGATLFYTDRFDFVSVPGQPAIDYVGTTGLLNSVAKYRTRFELGYERRGFDASVQALWTSPVKFDRNATIEMNDVNRVPGYWLVNGSVSQEIDEKVRFQLTVNNMFDAKVPYEARVGGTYRSYDVLGRYFTFGVTGKF